MPAPKQPQTHLPKMAPRSHQRGPALRGKKARKVMRLARLLILRKRGQLRQNPVDELQNASKFQAIRAWGFAL